MSWRVTEIPPWAALAKMEWAGEIPPGGARSRLRAARCASGAQRTRPRQHYPALGYRTHQLLPC
eukprot:3700572-Pyramimonas_sp.AAC.1